MLKADKVEVRAVFQWQISIYGDKFGYHNHESMCCLYVEPSTVIFRLTFKKQSQSHNYM